MSTVVGNRIPTSSHTSALGRSNAAPHTPSVAPEPERTPGELESLPFSATSRRLSGQLTQARLDEPAARHRREAVPQSIAGPARDTRKSPDSPARAAAEKADEKLQTVLTHWLISGKLHGHPVPENSSVKPFVDLFIAAAQEPKVQSWFKSKGLDLSTVCVYGDWVEGTAVVDGKHVTHKFTASDGSGWSEVGAKVTAAALQLSPDNHGVLLPDEKGEFRHVDVLLGFYGVRLPDGEVDGHAQGKHLKKHGWPVISQAQREQWAMQLKQQSRAEKDGAMRMRLSEQLQPLLEVKGQDDKLQLDELGLGSGRGTSLDQRSRKPRELFLEFLASPRFQAFLKKTGFEASSSEFRLDQFRLSEGDLQISDGKAHWMSLKQAFEDEIYTVYRGGTQEENIAVHKMQSDLNDLMYMGKKTGDALYSARIYDVRQTLAFYALDVPQTVDQLRATLGWLNMRLPQPPLAGNYASMTPYGPTPGALSASATQVLKAASGEVMNLLKEFSEVTSGFRSFPDADCTLAAFFDSPGLVEVADRIARSINLYSVSDGQPLPRAERVQLLATALKLSVNVPLPQFPGMVAGYDLYQPANMGRTLKEVRSDVEKQLQSKGVDVEVSALMAHLFLAHCAPEMLIKKDPAVSADTAKILNQDPENIKVGSAGWINMRLASAVAGDRRLNFTQAMTVARQAPAGPNQEKLIQDMGAPALLDWGAMAGIYPATPDRHYSLENYAAAATAFTEREQQINQAFGVLASESPTQTSLLITHLAQLFPEMSEDEIRNLKLLDYPDQHQSRNVGVHQGPRKNSPKLLTDVILMNQFAGQPPLGRNAGWTKGAFIHPKVSLETFRERLKNLPLIEPLVVPAIHNYILNLESAQAVALTQVITQLFLQDRQALDAGKIEFFTLREETGEKVEQDSGADSKVPAKRGAHGLLLRYETVTAPQRYGYYEIFPNSLKIVKRTDLPYKLPLDGSVEKPFASGRWLTDSKANYRVGSELPFDFEAYKTGSQPRDGVKSKVIVERYGTDLAHSPITKPFVPDTFGSSRTTHIVERVQGFAFQGNREERVAHANEQSVLLKRSYPSAPGAKLFTPENARAVISLIPFVGAVADLVEGKTGDGVKGLLIDVASLLATGGLAGLKGFAKGAKLLFKFNGQPFTKAALKGAGTFLRGVLNPVENVPEIFRAPGKIYNGLKAIAKGDPAHIGDNIYLPVKMFEQWRWTSGAIDTLFSGGGGSANQWGARKGFSGNQQVEAVEKNGLWYRVNTLSRRPEGAPLEQFIPDKS